MWGPGALGFPVMPFGMHDLTVYSQSIKTPSQK